MRFTRKRGGSGKGNSGKSLRKHRIMGSNPKKRANNTTKKAQEALIQAEELERKIATMRAEAQRLETMASSIRKQVAKEEHEMDSLTKAFGAL
jgi:uncharacterized small protein (DUF1192 family)